MMLELVNVYDKLDAFVTCEDVKNSKPEPDIFLKAADLLGIRPENCLVIEDAVN
jgi:HAD superfamily hydrolase (TIGR01509 family)